MAELELKYQQLENKAKMYITKQESLDLIRRAFEYARNNHGEQLRKSGEQFIHHPVEVATILADLQAGPATIAAGLLHDVLEDTDVTEEEMTNEFGEEITSLVDGVT